MRCSGWSSRAISACSAAALAALLLAATASAHVVARPQFLPAEGRTTLVLEVPNERNEPMSGLSVTLPAGLAPVQAAAPSPWELALEGPRATWTSGSLPPGLSASFPLAVEASTEPGPATLQVEQRYPGGEVVRWPLALTVTPGSVPREHPWRGIAVALVGLGLLAGLGALAWRRRDRAA
ncbi:MAG TPA: hypothetical protein VNJ53_13540 [Gaiellaceae bacterium]|nr:hypothetical protein [Gaiellaceae bacterium]